MRDFFFQLYNQMNQTDPKRTESSRINNRQKQTTKSKLPSQIYSREMFFVYFFFLSYTMYILWFVYLYLFSVVFILFSSSWIMILIWLNFSNYETIQDSFVLWPMLTLTVRHNIIYIEWSIILSLLLLQNIFFWTVELKCNTTNWFGT